MKEFEGKFLRIHNKLPFAAIVKIRIEETENSYVKIDCIGDGWIAQGYLESVSENGYKTWKEGAIIGANFALKKSSNSFGITIFEINGIITDTSPTSVGAATIYAVWKAIKYIPNQEEIQRIEKIVFSSGYDNLPDF